jgi:hypothetical protein
MNRHSRGDWLTIRQVAERINEWPDRARSGMKARKAARARVLRMIRTQEGVDGCKYLWRRRGERDYRIHESAVQQLPVLRNGYVGQIQESVEELREAYEAVLARVRKLERSNSTVVQLASEVEKKAAKISERLPR